MNSIPKDFSGRKMTKDFRKFIKGTWIFKYQMPMIWAKSSEKPTNKPNCIDKINILH